LRSLSIVKIYNRQCWGLFEILVFEIRISNTIHVFCICIANTVLKEYFEFVFQIHLCSICIWNILIKYKNTIQNCLSNKSIIQNCHSVDNVIEVELCLYLDDCDPELKCLLKYPHVKDTFIRFNCSLPSSVRSHSHGHAQRLSTSFDHAKTSFFNVLVVHSEYPVHQMRGSHLFYDRL